MDSDVVVVLGSPRSGTSSVAQALAALGLYLDTADALLTGDEENSDGYWEHKELSTVFGQLQIAMNQGVNYLDTLPEGWRELPRVTTLLDSMREIVARRFKDQPLWGWKNPISSSQIPIIVEGLAPLKPRLHFVICVRHPLATARSQMSKYGVPFDVSLGIWMWNTMEALRYSRSYPCVVVPFPEIVDKPRPYLENIVSAVRGWQPTNAQWKAAGDLFKPRLIHNTQTDCPEHFSDIIMRIYNLAIECADNYPRFATGGFDDAILEIYQEMRGWQNMLRPNTLAKDEVRAWYQNGNEVKSVSVPYTPTRSWQSVTLEFPASTAPVPVYFYFLPVFVWIRHAEWTIGDYQEPAKVQGAKFGLHTKVERFDHLSTMPGAEQCFIVPPSHKGQAKLEIEFMIEPSVQHQGETFRNVIQALDNMQTQLAAARQNPGLRRP